MSAERITQADVHNRVEAINRILVERHLDTRVGSSGRNGHNVVESFTGYPGRERVETLATGTKREVYVYLGAMLQTLWLTGRSR